MNNILIIAEAGVNHNGSLEIAKQMVDAAKECGVDIIKFQTARPEAMVSRFAPQAEYQKKNTGREESQLAMLKELMLTYSEYEELYRYCRRKEIFFLSTPFDLESIEFLNRLDMPFWKIPSGEITNYPYLVKIGQTHKKVVMSTGMSTIQEIEEVVCLLKESGCPSITLLHCNTQYPTPFEDVNLSAMAELKSKFNVEVGYSDHTSGIEVPIAAAALGASVIEKHFTLARNMEGPDHKASLEPSELKQMVRAVRNIEKAIGSSEKRPAGSEKENIPIARKSIVAKTKIHKGEIFTEQNITTKRPGNGISPMRWKEVLGQYAVKDFEEDEMIVLSEV